MNILITDDAGNLKLFVAIDKIGHIEFTATAAVMYFAPGHEVWTDSTRLFVIGNSRAKLEHALLNQARQANLKESEVLTDAEFLKWNQQPQKQELAGLLETAELVKAG